MNPLTSLGPWLSRTGLHLRCVLVVIFLGTPQLSIAQLSDADALTKIMERLNADESIVNSLLVYRPGDDLPAVEIASGLADPTTNTSMTTNHQFRIASMSKSFTAVLALHLAQQGLFSLDDSLNDLTQRKNFETLFPNHAFGLFDTPTRQAGALTVDDLLVVDGKRLGGTITMRQLLQHTHGMPDITFDAVNGNESAAESLLLNIIDEETQRPGFDKIQFSGERLLEFFLHSGLSEAALFEPGEGFHYSDTGYIIAGLVIEKVTGLSLADAYRQYLFDPLGLHDTYLEWYEPARVSSSIGLSHAFWNLRVPGEDAVNLDLVALNANTSLDWAGGGLVSTAQDLHRFLVGLSAGRVLNDQSLSEMTDWVDGGDGPYGLGFEIILDDDGLSPIGYQHTGFWGSQMVVLPDSGTTLVMTANQVDPQVHNGIDTLQRAANRIITSARMQRCLVTDKSISDKTKTIVCGYRSDARRQLLLRIEQCRTRRVQRITDGRTTPYARTCWQWAADTIENRSRAWAQRVYREYRTAG